jgi:diguanylate cyclase (GGDEF)-like protein
VRAARDRTRSIEALTRRTGQRDEASDRLAVSMRELAADLRPDEVLGKIASHAQSAVGGKEFALLLADDGMRCVRSSGIPDASVQALESWAAKPGHARRAGDDRRRRGVRARPALARAGPDDAARLAVLGAAALPGPPPRPAVALAHGPEAFLPHDADLLSSYAGQAAVALSNATLVERLERMAHEDALTGLANQRHFHRRMTEEGVRSERENTPLSVVLLDLDHFKRINDTHGHARGDEVLRAVGAALRGSVRPYDTVARLGGEEFAVILPGTHPDQAYALAERIRAAIARVQVEGVTLSCSAGVAGWPDDTTDLSVLLRLADGALYSAKAAGRGRTRRYDGEVLAGRDLDAAGSAARIRAVLEDPSALQIVFQPGAQADDRRHHRLRGARPLSHHARHAARQRLRAGPRGRPRAGARGARDSPRDRRARPPGRDDARRQRVAVGARVAEPLGRAAARSRWGHRRDHRARAVRERRPPGRTSSAGLRDRGARIAVDERQAPATRAQHSPVCVPRWSSSTARGRRRQPADIGKAALTRRSCASRPGTVRGRVAEGDEELADLSPSPALDVTSAQGLRPIAPPARPGGRRLAAGAGGGHRRDRVRRARARLPRRHGDQLDILQRLVPAGTDRGVGGSSPSPAAPTTSPCSTSTP